jgi:hypothetical protein
MPRTILIDEIHIGMHVPKTLPEAEFQAIRSTLNDPRFQKELRQAVEEVVSRYVALGKVSVVLSR